MNKLNRVFDSENKELMNKPIIIPFVPMTLFDSIIESMDLYDADEEAADRWFSDMLNCIDVKQ